MNSVNNSCCAEKTPKQSCYTVQSLSIWTVVEFTFFWLCTSASRTTSTVDGWRILATIKHNPPKHLSNRSELSLGRNFGGFRDYCPHKTSQTLYYTKGYTARCKPLVSRKCMGRYATGASSLAFIDNVTDDSSSGMNSAVYRSILLAQVASKLIWWRFIPQQNNDPKHTPVLSFFFMIFKAVCFGKPIVYLTYFSAS